MTRTPMSLEKQAVEQRDQPRAESAAPLIPDGPVPAGKRGQGT